MDGYEAARQIRALKRRDAGTAIIAMTADAYQSDVEKAKAAGMDRMRREFKVEATAGAPQVAYRETIRKSAECEGRFIRQTGGHGQYGDVWIRFEPNEGKGFEFVDAVVGGTVPKEYIKPTQQGLEQALPNGLIAGYPIVDLKATLFDGSYHGDVRPGGSAVDAAVQLYGRDRSVPEARKSGYRRFRQ